MYSLSRRIEHAHTDGIWSVCWTNLSDKIVTGSIDEKVNVLFVFIFF